MKSLVRAGLLALLSLQTAATLEAQQPTPAQPPRPCESQPTYRQFDFWVGEWDVRSFASQGGPSVGSSKVERLSGGCVIQENWAPEGKSWNFFDVTVNKWRQIWIDPSGRRAEMSGTFADSAMRFEGETILANGTRFRNRMTFFVLDSNKVRQQAERSLDGGLTWNTTVDLLYLRKTG